MNQRPIEIDFPIEQVNEITGRETHVKEESRLGRGDYTNAWCPPIYFFSFSG